MTIHALTTAGEGSRFNVQSSKLPSVPSTLNHERGTSNSAPRGSRDTPELRATFNEFVGQTFFGELIKQMRATVDKPAFFHGGMGEDIFQSQLDQVLVKNISDASAATFSDPMYQLLLARR